MLIIMDTKSVLEIKVGGKVFCTSKGPPGSSSQRWIGGASRSTVPARQYTSESKRRCTPDQAII